MVNMKIHTWTLFSLCRTESSKCRLCTLMFLKCVSAKWALERIITMIITYTIHKKRGQNAV